MKQKLVQLQMFVTLIILFFATSIFYFYSRHTSQQNHYAFLSSLAEVMAYNLVTPLLFNDESETRRILRTISLNEDISNSYIFNVENKLVSMSSGDKNDRVSAVFPLDQGIVHQKNGGVLYYKKIYDNGTQLGTLVIKSELRSLKKVLANYTLIFAGLIIFGLIFAIILSNFSQKSISSPVNYLIDTLQKIIESRKYSIRIDKSVGKINEIKEFSNLADKFNFMLNAVEKSQKRIMTMNESLEEKVKVRTSELEEARKESIENAHMAGMAEVANNILHNVGNVLNSVVVSTDEVHKVLMNSKNKDFKNISALLKNKQVEEYSEFFGSDPKGKKIPQFICQLSELIDSEFVTIMNEAEHIKKNISHIQSIIDAQKSFIKSKSFVDDIEVDDLIQSCLKISLSGVHNIDLKIENRVQNIRFKSDRHKLMQILINFITNAKHSALEQGNNPTIVISAEKTKDNMLKLEVVDNGLGINKEIQNKIFTHGFTTKRKGTGFGLHSSANAVAELGGRIYFHSEGEGHGATFGIFIPMG